MKPPRSLRSLPPEGAFGPLGSGPALADMKPDGASLRSLPPEGAFGPLGSGPALADCEGVY